MGSAIISSCWGCIFCYGNLWTAGGTGYSLDWTMLNGASMDCAIVLPVELVRFDAKLNDNKVMLSWLTESELNNDFFLVERSYDGESFNSIGEVKGSGNSNTPIEYYFVDEKYPSKTVYYRLRQVDFDGKYEYSDIISVSPIGKQNISVFPNPTMNNLNVKFVGLEEEELNVKIVDISGKVIYDNNYYSFSKDNVYILDMSKRHKGFYYLTVTGNNTSHREKILVK